MSADRLPESTVLVSFDLTAGEACDTLAVLTAFYDEAAQAESLDDETVDLCSNIYATVETLLARLEESLQ